LGRHRRGHGDDAFWSWHLHLEVGVVRGHHELGITRTPQDGVVRAPEPDHLEDEDFLAEVVQRAKPDRQIDLPEGLDALAQRDTMERRRAGPLLVQPDPHQP
jgi:hypothetical protein